MENNYSYAEFLKSVGKNSTSPEAEKLLNDIYMDLFFNHIHREQTKKRLMDLIDLSLDERDVQAFNLYSEKYLQMNESE